MPIRRTLTLTISLLLALLVIGSVGSMRLANQLHQQAAQIAAADQSRLVRDLLVGTLNQADPAAQSAVLAPIIATLNAQPAPAAGALAAALEAYSNDPNPATRAAAHAAVAPYAAVHQAHVAALTTNLAAAQPLGVASLVLFTAAGGIAALILWQFNRAFLGPLKQLSTALNAVGSGNLTVRLPQHPPGEFAPLIDAYRQMVSALLERQRALDEQLRRTAILTHLSIALRETLDPTTIAERVLHAAGADLGGNEALLILRDPTGAPQAGYAWADDRMQPVDHATLQRRSAHGAEGWASHTGRSLQIDDLSDHELWQAGGGAPAGSAIVLPLRQQGVSLGSLTLVAYQPRRFTSRDRTLLEGIAAQAGVALSAAQRYQDERERRKQAMALLHTSQFLAVERGVADLAMMFAEQCRAVFGAADARLYLLDRPDAPPAAVTTPGAPSDPALRTLADETAATACNQRQISLHQADATEPTCLALPLISAGTLLGAGVIIRPAGVGAQLSTNLWSLLTVFTGLIATAVANVRLVERLREQTSALANQVEQRTEELRHSRDLLRIVFDNLPEGLLLMNTDGTLLAANNAFSRSIAGRRPQDIVGTEYRALWHDLARQSDLRLEPQHPAESDIPPLVPAAEAPFSTTAASWRVLGTDFVGQQRWYAVERTPISRRGIGVDQFLERWRDITLQEELQRRMLLHEQLTSLGRLAASVAHEVGNPLQSAMSCLELCREDASLSERSRDYLGLALGELERMGRTLESLRNLYRPPQTVWEQVDLNSIAQQVVQFTQRQFQRARITVSLHLDASLPPIWGQPDAVRQVLLNLLLNAQEAMPQGGQIELTTRCKATDRVCELSIHDTGSGMTPEQINHVFEPFRSNKAQGVGLGLALSRQIMEQHAGHITLASAVGKGTTVTLHIPWITNAH